MTRLKEHLRQSRALRDAAWALVRQDADFLRADLARRGIGRRVVDRALLAARDGASGARAMARENRGLVAGGVAAIALWMLHKPLRACISRWLARDGTMQDERTENAAEHDNSSDNNSNGVDKHE